MLLSGNSLSLLHQHHAKTLNKPGGTNERICVVILQTLSYFLHFCVIVHVGRGDAGQQRC